ncbi:MAG: hypothetical protein IPO68_11655, partial [Chitinophagaceae bacterium]|nr:hypothetical protein [Chitinophagaceae bacterium]
MPSSSPFQISQVVNWIIYLKPSKVLDIGIGNGKYGFLCREALDTPHEEIPNRITVHGIEGFESYITDVHRLIYDKIFIGNGVDILKDHPEQYDLVLLIDVIEHLDKNTGMHFLERLLEISKNVIVTTPYGYVPQDDVFGNDFEVHRSGWVEKDFRNFEGALIKKIDYQIISLLGKDTAKVKEATFRYKLSRQIAYNKLIRPFFKAARFVGLIRIPIIRKLFRQQ